MFRIFAGVVVCLLAFSGTMAQAAAVSPESVTLTVKQGEKVQQTIRFENDTTETKSYSIELSKISFGSSADDLRFEPLGEVEQSWILLDRSSFVLGPEADQAIELTVSVPTGTEAQVLSFAVIATAQTAEASGIGVTSGSASLIFVEIGGDLGANLQIATFGAVPDNAHQLPIRFAALVSNLGAGLSEPEVGVVLKNMWGKEVELISLNPTSRRLPGYTSRIFTEEWQGSPWRFGPYTAELYVFPSNSDAVITSTTSVVLFPWRMLCVFAVAGLILGAAVYAFLRARRR